MHELGLVVPMVDTVVESASEAGAQRVRRVHVSVGMARDVMPDLLDMAFTRLCEGTVAEGAQLVVTRVPVSEGCEDCGMVFPLDLRDESGWHCPRCGSRRYHLRTGREFQIDRIEVDRAPSQADAA